MRRLVAPAGHRLVAGVVDTITVDRSFAAFMVVALLATGARAEPSTPAAAPVPASAAPLATAPVLDEAALTALIDARLAARPALAGWEDGFFLASDDGRARLTIGGLLQIDGRFFLADAREPHVDQFLVRAARLDVQATTLGRVDLRLIPDVAGSKLTLVEAHAVVRLAADVAVRVGKLKVPFGLERLQAESCLTFTDRGLPSQLAPATDVGVELRGELGDHQLAYQLGVFDGGDATSAKDVAARLWLTPFAHRPGPLAGLAVGGAVMVGARHGTLAAPDVPTFKTAGQTTYLTLRSGPTLDDTVIADGRQWRATAHGRFERGPVSVMAEYVYSRQATSLAGVGQAVAFDAWQVVGQWVLTGADASSKGIKPRAAFDPGAGAVGAIAVAARLGGLRDVSGAAAAATLMDPTAAARRVGAAGLGLDWFVSGNVRAVVDVERTWYRLGAAGVVGAVDRAPETTAVVRLQTTF